jgi:hypothetical protein
MVKILEQLENQKAAMMEFRMKNSNHWARLLAYVTGLINQELLEYLAAENRILRARTCQPGCGCRIRSDARWLRSASDSDAKL